MDAATKSTRRKGDKLLVSCGELFSKNLTSFADRFIIYLAMPKRTYQPKKRTRAKKHGFLKRAKSAGGREVLKRLRGKGRAKLSA